MVRLFASLWLIAAATGQCTVQAVTTQTAGTNACQIFVSTTLTAQLSAPCQLDIRAAAAAYYLFRPTYALLVLGDSQASLPLAPLPGCFLFTNPVVSLWQPYVSGQSTFSFAVPPLALPMSLYAQAATICWYATTGCQHGSCFDYAAFVSNGLQITLQ